MDLTKTPQKEIAASQWMNLHHHILRLGGWLEYVEHADGWPDMVFTANAGLVRGREVVISKFRFKERAGEELDIPCTSFPTALSKGRETRSSREIPSFVDTAFAPIGARTKRWPLC
jgi:hypothetical protein